MAAVKNDYAREDDAELVDYIKWGLILFNIISTILWRMHIGPALLATNIFFFTLFAIAMMHGAQRYGYKNMIVWFIMAWVVSNLFEALSIRTGFPFGHYHYNMSGPRLFDVPLFIMGCYFGLAYISWTVAQTAIGHFNKRIAGWYKLIIPISTAMVMTMWDLATDPQASYVEGNWTWENGGAYFGVPISNFAGWVFVVWVFMQLFTLFISNKNLDVSKNNVTAKKTYWSEAVIVYLWMGLGIVLEGILGSKENAEMFSSMALVSVFTMVFTSFISFLNIVNANVCFQCIGSKESGQMHRVWAMRNQMTDRGDKA